MSVKSQFAVAVVNEINLDVTGIKIAAGGTVSSVLNCGGTAPTGIILPANWTPSVISFNVCKTPNGTFVPLTNFDGSAFSITTGASLWIPLNPMQFNSILYLQIVCVTTQSFDVVVDFALAPIYQGVHA